MLVVGDESAALEVILELGESETNVKYEVSQVASWKAACQEATKMCCMTGATKNAEELEAVLACWKWQDGRTKRVANTRLRPLERAWCLRVRGKAQVSQVVCQDMLRSSIFVSRKLAGELLLSAC